MNIENAVPHARPNTAWEKKSAALTVAERCPDDARTVLQMLGLALSPKPKQARDEMGRPKS